MKPGKSILKIKELLKEKGMTINDLAKEMGLNRVTLSNMINGNPTLETLNKIAESLNLSVPDLFYEEEESMSKSFKWDYIREEWIFVAFDENVSLNAVFKDSYVHLSFRINSKDFELVSSNVDDKEFFDSLLVDSFLDVRKFFLKIIRNGVFIVRILSIEVAVTLFELESIIKAFQFLRYSYLTERYTYIR